jgi:hypothetical protein
MTLTQLEIKRGVESATEEDVNTLQTSDGDTNDVCQVGIRRNGGRLGPPFGAQIQKQQIPVR